MAEISYLLNKLSLSYVQVLFSGINNLCGLFVWKLHVIAQNRKIFCGQNIIEIYAKRCKQWSSIKHISEIENILSCNLHILKKIINATLLFLPPFFMGWTQRFKNQFKTQWTNTSRWQCTPNHHRLWKLNTGLQATWAMSFSTLPPDSMTLVSKLNTKLALIWKEDFGPLGNSPVLLLLSPGKTHLTTTVDKFLDTSVCGSWCLDPSLSPFLVKLTQILESDAWQSS